MQHMPAEHLTPHSYCNHNLGTERPIYNLSPDGHYTTRKTEYMMAKTAVIATDLCLLSSCTLRRRLSYALAV